METLTHKAIEKIVRLDIEQLKKNCTRGEIKNCEGPLEELQRLLIQPRKRLFTRSDTFEVISAQEESVKELWVILEDDISDYCIVFDPEQNTYGLALRGEETRGAYIGVNGDLFYVFNAM